MNTTFSIRTILRWIAILPGAVFVGILSTFPLHWVLYSNLADGELISGVNIYPLESALSPFVIAITYIWAGSLIAPKFKREASIILAVLYAVAFISIFVFLPNAKLQFAAAGALAGILVGLFLVWKATGVAAKSALTPAAK